MAGEAITSAGFAFLRDADNRGLTHDQMLAAFETASRGAENPLMVSDLAELIPQAEVPQPDATRVAQTEEVKPYLPVASQPKLLVSDGSSFELKYDGGGVKIEMRGPASVVGDFDWSQLLGVGRPYEEISEIPTYESAYEMPELTPSSALSSSPLPPVSTSFKAGRMPVVVEKEGFTVKTVGKKTDRSQKNKQSRSSVAKNNRGNTTAHKGRRFAAAGLVIAVVLGIGGVVKLMNREGEQAVPDGAEAFGASYFTTNEKTQPVATMEYSNSGEIQANYTAANGKVAAVPTEVIGQKLPVSDAGKANISVTWLGSDAALSSKDGKVYVARNEFGLVATNLTASIPAKKCNKTSTTPFQDSLCMTFLSTKVAEKTDIGFVKEKADAVNALIYYDGKTYNTDAALGIYVMQVSAGLNTTQSKECMAPATAITDSVLADRFKDKGKVVFVGAYKTVGEMYNEQTDVKTILGADALSVTAVTTTCNKAVRQ